MTVHVFFSQPHCFIDMRREREMILLVVGDGNKNRTKTSKYRQQYEVLQQRKQCEEDYRLAYIENQQGGGRREGERAKTHVHNHHQKYELHLAHTHGFRRW